MWECVIAWQQSCLYTNVRFICLSLSAYRILEHIALAPIWACRENTTLNTVCAFVTYSSGISIELNQVTQKAHKKQSGIECVYF